MMLLPSSAFLLAVRSIATTRQILPISKNIMTNIARPPSTASLLSSTSCASSTVTATTSNGGDQCKPRILCLHGKFQSGAIFSNKIAGARRKIEREYELDFLDGPILLPQDDGDNTSNDTAAYYGWWQRSEDGKHTLVREALEYVLQNSEYEKYDGIIGFSQGGTLSTALALSGAMPKVRAVVTAGAPFVQEAFDVAQELSKQQSSSIQDGLNIPKLHLAGETDSLVPMESMRALCEKGGNGKFIVHDQGHLFPTRSARVKEILDFLAAALHAPATKAI